MRRSLIKATFLVFAACLSAGCSVTSTWHAGPASSGPEPTVKTFSKEKIEQSTKERIEKRLGRTVDSLVCDGPIEREVGATQRCVLSDEGQKAGVTLTVTKVEDGKVDFNWEIDDHLLPE
ncbi:DUF4333 domain-containing protein [Mycobacteroides abscessus]|uniref:DUF4333 domain-containing protein n=1 Tax=Mycobacteroides abscessus TaxID=36809 RepID=UPI001C550AD4|nr:DUF4333 domain-containing protein [Mycobacteroides abscessus]